MAETKNKGEQITWNDKNGKEHSGRILAVETVVYKVATPDGLIYRISKTIE